MKEKERKNLKQKKFNFQSLKASSGITLIALVITIIVMLILVAVTITMAINGGIFNYAGKAVGETQNAINGEQSFGTNQIEIDGKVYNSIEEVIETTPQTGVKVIVDGKTETLTKSNVGKYLGRIVTNYKPTADSVTIDDKPYNVSTTYRLYYVDFDGYYGEKDAIYLKADCVNSSYSLQLDDSSADKTNIKIKDLNPELYKNGDENAPDSSNLNMMYVTWLTNINNWDDLKEGVDTEIAKKINYIVGAPSLEMMIDSYNTHYAYLKCFDLADDTPDTTTTLKGTNSRVKLFCKYPYNDYKYGYGVGPSNNSAAIDKYYSWTSDYTVKADTEIGTMYYPGDGFYYWLSSPSAYDSDRVAIASSSGGGRIEKFNYTVTEYGLCPLVSLNSSVQLELGK